MRPPFVTSAPSFREIVQGVVDGVLVSVLVTGYLLYLRAGRWRTWFWRLGFWTDLTLSSTVVLLLFLLGRGLGASPTLALPHDGVFERVRQRLVTQGVPGVELHVLPELLDRLIRAILGP